MSIQIRKLLANDREALEAVLRSDQTFRADEVDVALELIDDALGNEASDYWFRLAMQGDSVAGYICYGPTPMTLATYDLYWIVCHAQYRGQGVARALVEQMESELRPKHSSVHVRVETSQTEGYGAARKLYDRLEYPEVARFSDFYKPGDDLIVFYKAL